MQKFLTTTFTLGLLFLLCSSFVEAQVSPPSATPFLFPSCVSPSGTVIASHSEGIHGISGDFGVYTGRDTVYALSEGNVLQCFCPTGGGAGIQTSWLNAASFSQEKITSLTNEGWNYIVSGIVWGLSDHPYMTRNISFACSSSPAVRGSESSIGSYGAGGGSEEQVLGATTSPRAKKVASARALNPRVAGTTIEVLPAAGSPYISLIIAVFAYVIATVLAIRL